MRGEWKKRGLSALRAAECALLPRRLGCRRSPLLVLREELNSLSLAAGSSWVGCGRRRGSRAHSAVASVQGRLLKTGKGRTLQRKRSTLSFHSPQS